MKRITLNKCSLYSAGDWCIWWAFERLRGNVETWAETACPVMRCPRGNSRVISEYREFGCATLYFLYSFSEYVNNGLKRIHVKFYIEGSEPGKQGTVHAEVGEVCQPQTIGSLRVIGVQEAPESVITSTCLSEPREWPVWISIHICGSDSYKIYYCWR